MVEKRVPGSLKTGSFLAAFVVLLSLQGCGSAQDANATQAERSALLVNVREAQPAAAYTIEREFAGRVEARRRSDLGFELGGELERVGVDEGDYVARGDVLASLDRARLEAQLAEAEASLAEARSASAFAARTLERSRVAASFEGISNQELDLAADNANTSAAALAGAEARLERVRVDLAKSLLRAPFDAIVVARHIDEGQILSPGQAVLAVQESVSPEVRIGVAGTLSERLAVGESRSLVINGRTVPAVVDAVLPFRDPTTRTVDVILSIDDGSTVPGDLARLMLKERVEARGFWLPVSALAEGNRGLWTAYVAMPIESPGSSATGATHYLEPRPVEILYEATDRVFVRGALSEGDRYVSGGLTRVVPNQQVRLASDPAPAVGS